MITFEEYLDGLKELQEEHELKATSARQSSLILDRIIENAKKEKAQLRIDLDNHTKKIASYQKQASKDNKFTVKVEDLRKALAKVYKVKLRDISIDSHLWNNGDDVLHGYVSIDVKYDDVMCYEPNKLTHTYCIGIDENTEFSDGTKLVDNLSLEEISMARIDYDLANGKKVKDLQVDISLTNGYMLDRDFVEALRLCFKNQGQILAK